MDSEVRKPGEDEANWQEPGTGGHAEVAARARQDLLARRDQARERANEFEKGVGEAQGVYYETTVYRIMERTNDNPELLTLLRDLLNELDAQSRAGEAGEQEGPMSVEKQRETAELLEQSIKTFRIRENRS